MADLDFSILPESILKSEIKADIVDALTFISLRFNERYTMEQCAEKMNLNSRQSMYNQLKRWRTNGAYQKAEEVILLPKILDARIANQQVVARWPEVIDRILDISINARSDKNAIEAAIFLKPINDEIVDAAEDPGSSETAYANRPADMSPDVITIPKRSVKDNGSVMITGEESTANSPYTDAPDIQTPSEQPHSQPE